MVFAVTAEALAKEVAVTAEALAKEVAVPAEALAKEVAVPTVVRRGRRDLAFENLFHLPEHYPEIVRHRYPETSH